MKLGFDLIELDRANMLEDEKTLTVKDAVIAREIVHAFNGTMIFKPADELFKATFTAGNAWLTEGHPPVGFVTDRSEIRGTVSNPHFKNNGIYTDLVFFKDLCSEALLQEVKSGERAQLSIGYFFSIDPTTGVWQGEDYDSIQRNFYIDHVAVIKDRARCPPPFCGIGVDEFIKVVDLRSRLAGEGKLVGGDPWEETTGEIRQRVQDPGKFDDESFRSSNLPTKGVRIIVACPKGKWVNNRCTVGMQLQAYRFSKEAGWTLEKAKAWYKEHHEDVSTNIESAEVGCQDGLDEVVGFIAERRRLAAEAQEGKVWSIEEIKQRIIDLEKRRQQIHDILYPRDVLPESRKQELRAELAVLDAEIQALQEVWATKMEGDQEREAKRRAAEKRAARWKIAVKLGGNLSVPKGYPARPEQYGDPTNFRYPLDTKLHRGAALRYFARPGNRRQYSRREQLIIWERIVRALLRHGEVHHYDKNNPLDRGLPASLKRRLPGYTE